MPVIQVSSDLLDRIADAAANAAKQTKIHIDGEIEGLIPELMDTLAPEGPYAYTIIPQVRPDGSVHLPVLTTREEIRKAYEMVRGETALLRVSALTEIRGEWYTFQDSISRTRRHDNGKLGASQTIALFPTGQGGGITGELVWARRPRSTLGLNRGATDGEALSEMYVREQVFELHQSYIDAMLQGDTGAVLDTLNDGVASAIRNYVDDAGGLMMLEGKDAHRVYYDALFAKYDMLSVTPFDRVAEEWYVFAELRMKARERKSGQTKTFNTAAFFAPAQDGRFVACIGHGTDPVSAQ
jgi:hypothetical protein